MSQLSDNALLQAAVTRLEQLTGQTVDITGASNNRLLQHVVTLLAVLEPGDGSGGGGSGPPGKSAYELAQDEGFTGTLEEWLESLVGPPGQDGEDGQDGTGGGAPSDAFSPSNKPRLSAVGTANAIQPLTTGANPSPQYFGPRLETLAEPRVYERLEVPLRDVEGGEELGILVCRYEGGSWVVRYRQDTPLTAGQTLVTFEGPFEFAAGETWAIAVGFSVGGLNNRFYGTSGAPYAPPLSSASIYRTTPSTAGVGQNAGLVEATGQNRVVQLYGLSEPKGVLGPADPADYTRSGTTAQRPAGMPTGMNYFDTTLGRPIFWNGAAWVDSGGNAV